MIDLNTLISNALTAAITSAVAPLNERIAVLEKNEEYLTNRIAALETKLTEANLFTQMTPATITADAFVTHLDQQEWFWEKLQNRIDAATEQAMDLHIECYDHDNYDEMASKVYETDFDDYVTRDSVREEIEDVINNATISIRA